MEPWHTLPADAVSHEVGVDHRSGLSDAEARTRLAQVGPNRLREAATRHRLSDVLAMADAVEPVADIAPTRSASLRSPPAPRTAFRGAH